MPQNGGGDLRDEPGWIRGFARSHRTTTPMSNLRRILRDLLKNLSEENYDRTFSQHCFRFDLGTAHGHIGSDQVDGDLNLKSNSFADSQRVHWRDRPETCLWNVQLRYPLVGWFGQRNSQKRSWDIHRELANARCTTGQLLFPFLLSIHLFVRKLM